MDASPYALQLDSPVRGLSAQEVDDLLTGRGMGYARMAELNSYPGPRHVLDLQTELKLSVAQVTGITTIFAQMQAQAQQLGQQIVSQEEQLSAALASTEIDEVRLEEQVMALANLYGQLRTTHLRAHLQVMPLLNEEQIKAYNVLRGYTGNQPSNIHEMNH
jgi:Spy/CpxP family protein refolding chaperone